MTCIGICFILTVLGILELSGLITLIKFRKLLVIISSGIFFCSSLFSFQIWRWRQMSDLWHPRSSPKCWTLLLTVIDVFFRPFSSLFHWVIFCACLTANSVSSALSEQSSSTWCIFHSDVVVFIPSSSTWVFCFLFCLQSYFLLHGRCVPMVLSANFALCVILGPVTVGWFSYLLWIVYSYFFVCLPVMVFGWQILWILFCSMVARFL
jgi:hypothetical protein